MDKWFMQVRRSRPGDRSYNCRYMTQSGLRYTEDLYRTGFTKGLAIALIIHSLDRSAHPTIFEYCRGGM